MNWVAPIKDEQVLQKFKDTLKEIDEKYLILFAVFHFFSILINRNKAKK